MEVAELADVLAEGRDGHVDATGQECHSEEDEGEEDQQECDPAGSHRPLRMTFIKPTKPSPVATIWFWSSGEALTPAAAVASKIKPRHVEFCDKEFRIELSILLRARVKFALDSLDDGSGAGDDGEHFGVGCFEVLDELLCLFVHAGLEDIEAACEISEQGEYGGKSDDEQADEEPAVALTAGVIRQLEQLLVHFRN